MEDNLLLISFLISAFLSRLKKIYSALCSHRSFLVWLEVLVCVWYEVGVKVLCFYWVCPVAPV